MQQTRAVEIGTGLFVFLGFAALLFLSTQTTNLERYIGADFYRVTAQFDNVGGLKPRSPVSMSGVTIGRVEKIEFDPERLNAVVTIDISGKYDRIPEDSDASILTSGLLGGQYVGLQAGGSDGYLKDGDEITLTQSAVVLENLISKYLFSGGAQDDEEADAGRDTPQETTGTPAATSPAPPEAVEPATEKVKPAPDVNALPPDEEAQTGEDAPLLDEMPDEPQGMEEKP